MIKNKFKFSKEVEWTFDNNHIISGTTHFNRTSNKKSKRLKVSSIYYGILLCLLLSFLFVITTSVISAKPVNDSDINTVIYMDNNSSYKLLEQYLLEETDEKTAEKQPVNGGIPKKIEFSRYRVIKNDSVKKISDKFGLAIDTVILCNNLKKIGNLKAGTMLEIPNQDGRLISVKSNDSILKIADRYGISWEKLSDVNDLSSEVIHPGMKLFIPDSKMTAYEKNKLFGTYFIWPVQGKISSLFGSRIDPISKLYSFHRGIDIRNHEGTSVKASADGKVVFTGWDNVYGNFIMIKHENKIITMYAHLKNYTVTKGQEIKQGEKIGLIGSTGRSTGPHLHLGFFENGQISDPMKYLSK